MTDTKIIYPHPKLGHPVCYHQSKQWHWLWVRGAMPFITDDYGYLVPLDLDVVPVILYGYYVDLDWYML